MELLNRYVNNTFTQPDDALLHVLKTLEEHGIRNISVSAATGKWLAMFVEMTNAKRILEIGSLGGYSAISMLRGSETATLTSLEINSAYAELAQKNLAYAGYAARTTHLVGDAKQSLQSLIEQQATFDFFFIDADKESYEDYLVACIQLATPGAVIAIDNTLIRGAVYDKEEVLSEKHLKRAQFMRDFNQYVANHPLLKTNLLPIGDGVVCAIVHK